MSEQWKPIEGYEGCYEVSDQGWMRSIPHKVNTKGGKQRMSPGRILVQKLSNNGRYQVQLSKENKCRCVSVSRLVTKAFCPGWFEGAVVNHKDENPRNNRADNLEWCTSLYNTNYGTGKYRAAKTHWVAIIGTDKEGNEHRFSSIQEAAAYVGGKMPCISACCRKVQGKHNAYGYQWRYEDEELNRHYAERAERMRKTHDKPVIATDKDGKEFYFHSIKEATEKTGVDRASVIGCCKGYAGRHHAGGYKWRYANQHNV